MVDRLQVRAVIFDWAGTMIDYGSRAPAIVFQEIFKQEGIEISAAQAREPMGMAKREHIAYLTRMPDVAERWSQKFGGSASEEDIDRMYRKFLPLQKRVLGEHCDMIPGAVETFQWCKSNGILVGSSTGYTRELMDIVIPIAAAAGFSPDVVLCAEDAPRGRPAPWLIYECAKRLDVYPTRQILKVDDTVVGVQAGINAGTWTAGIAKTGNLIGLTELEFAALTDEDKLHRLDKARNQLTAAGAHFVIDSVADLRPVIDQINERLSKSEIPFYR